MRVQLDNNATAADRTNGCQCALGQAVEHIIGN